ncbi:MAG: hypothetical protein ACTHMZ_02020, partial [Actinomycetes bacterium]
MSDTPTTPASAAGSAGSGPDTPAGGAHAMARALPRSPLRIASVALVTVGLVLGCFGAVLGLAHRAKGTDAPTLVVLLGAAACTAAGCVLMELLDQRVTRAAGLPATAPSWAWSLGTLAL